MKTKTNRKMNKEIKMILVVLILAALVVIVAILLNLFGKNILLSPGEVLVEQQAVIVDYSSIAQILGNSQIVQEIPVGGLVLVKFYNDEQCIKQWEKSYIVTRGNVVEGTVSGQNYTILINSRYLGYYRNGLCGFLREANLSRGISIQTSLSSGALSGYNLSWAAYASCLESAKSPDLAVNLDDASFLRAFKGNTTNVSVFVTNNGEKKAESAKIELYEIPNTASQDETFADLYVGQVIMSNVSVLETRKVDFSFAPRYKGDVGIYAVVYAEGDLGAGNAYDFNHFLIRNKGLDGKVRDVNALDLRAGQSSKIYVNVDNAGAQKIENAELSVYADNVLVGTKYINISVSLVASLLPYEFDYIPSTAGVNVTIEAILTISGDLDTTDNSYEKAFGVHTLKKVNLTVTDSRGNWTSNRFVTVVGKQALSSVKVNEINLTEAPNYQSYFYFSRAIGESSNIREEALTKYELVTGSIPSEMGIISEQYDSIIQNGSTYYYVFANRADFAHFLSISGGNILISSEVARRIGMNKELRSYIMVACRSFNFSAGKCNGAWIESDESGAIIPGSGGSVNWDARFDGAIEAFGLTDSATLYTDFGTAIGNDACGVVMRKPTYGIINLNGALNMTRIGGMIGLIDSAVLISHRKITVNTSAVPELAGIPATLTFMNIDMRNPKVYRDGQLCSGEICKNAIYDSVNRTLIVNVTGFSTYEVVEGSYCGDSACQPSAGETCGTCSMDCGSCSSGGDEEEELPSGCLPNWTCSSFGPCTNGRQFRTCTDARHCGITYKRPALNQSCTITRTQEESDTTLTQEEQTTTETPAEESAFDLTLVAIIGGGVLILIIIIILVLVVLRKKPTIPAKGNEQAGAKDDVIKQARQVVQKSRQNGYNDNDIRAAFRAKGWNDSDIDSLLK